MKLARIGVVVLAALGILFGSITAATAAGTPDQAKALVEEAVKFYKANGRDAAFAEFNKTDGKFVKGDLYIFAFNMAGVTQAHGANAKLVGKDMIETKDPDGVFLIKEMRDIAKTKGSGWVDYKWSHPETKKLTPKTSYVVKVDDDTFLGCGAYK